MRRWGRDGIVKLDGIPTVCVQKAIGYAFLAPFLVRTVGQEDVDVVACNLTRDNVQLMFHRDLTNEVAHTNHYRTDEHLFTIFRYPDDGRFQVRFRVRSVLVVTHATTLPRPFLRLKARGFHHPRKGH